MWIAGFVLQFVPGTPLYTLSVGLAGPAIVPGLMSTCLVFLAIGAVVIQKEHVKAGEIAGIACVVAAVTMFGLSRLSIDVRAVSTKDPALLARTGGFAVVLIAIAVAGNAYGIESTQHDLAHGRTTTQFLVAAGVFLTVGVVLLMSRLGADEKKAKKVHPLIHQTTGSAVE